MYKMVFLIAASSILLFGCSHQNKLSAAMSGGANDNEFNYNNQIYKLSSDVSDVSSTFFDKILNSKTKLSDESIKSIEDLVNAKLKNASQTYDGLLKMTGSKQDEIDALKESLDKLNSMNDELKQYTDTPENKSKLLADWKIENNYWETYYQLSKK